MPNLSSIGIPVAVLSIACIYFLLSRISRGAAPANKAIFMVAVISPVALGAFMLLVQPSNDLRPDGTILQRGRVIKSIIRPSEMIQFQIESFKQCVHKNHVYTLAWHQNLCISTKRGDIRLLKCEDLLSSTNWSSFSKSAMAANRDLEMVRLPRNRDDYASSMGDNASLYPYVLLVLVAFYVGLRISSRLIFSSDPFLAFLYRWRVRIGIALAISFILLPIAAVLYARDAQRIANVMFGAYCAVLALWLLLYHILELHMALNTWLAGRASPDPHLISAYTLSKRRLIVQDWMNTSLIRETRLSGDALEAARAGAPLRFWIVPGGLGYDTLGNIGQEKEGTESKQDGVRS